MSVPSVDEHLKAGRVEEALATVRDSVRKEPAEPRFRRSLFQLLSVMGQWEKALTQLDVLADMDAESMVMAHVFRRVIACEMLRADVFKGARAPLILGEPQEWMALLVHGNALAACGKMREAREIIDRALEKAPDVSGTINGHPFEWIGDFDSRMGSVLEAIVEGHYYWVPFNRIARIEISRPADLRDIVWIPTSFVWTNGGEAAGFIPVRYSESESSADGAIRMAGKTEWRDAGEGFYFGLGQRMFTTDTDEYPLLETQTVMLNHPEQPPAETTA